MKKNVSAILFVLFCCAVSRGQSVQDSISTSGHIHELILVSIESDRSVRRGNRSLCDSLQYRRASGESLAQLLTRKGLGNITSYGAIGSAALARVGGSSPSQTLLSWHGLPINSPTLGMADLSLIPANAFEQIYFNDRSPQSNRQGSTIGSEIALSPDDPGKEKKEIHKVEVSFRANSIQNNNLSVVHHYSIKGLSSRFYIQKSDNANAFIYQDKLKAGQPWLTQGHNNSSDISFIEELGFSPQQAGYKLSAGFWGQKRSVSIPPIMGSYGNGSAKQYDNAMRAYCQYSTAGFQIKLGWLDDFQRYTDQNDNTEVLLIDSSVRTKQAIINSDWTHSVGLGKLKASFQGGNVEAINSNYESGKLSELFGAAAASYSLSHKHWTLNAAARIEKRGVFSPITASDLTADRVKVNAAGNKTEWSLSIQRKFRIPTLNDRYWIPGGNPNLKPEIGYSANIYWSNTLNWKGGNSLKSSIRGTASMIDNWIQWVPQSSSIWSPVNYKEVRSITIEPEVEHRHLIRKTNVRLLARGQFVKTLANNRTFDDQKQFSLIYTPVFTFFSSIDLERKNADIGVICRWSDKRYTNEANTALDALPSYGLIDFMAGYHFNFNPCAIDLRISIDNVFNTQYQLVNSYALPGRVVSLTLRFILNKPNKSIK
jgi:vitamin B12 transporter